MQFRRTEQSIITPMSCFFHELQNTKLQENNPWWAQFLFTLHHWGWEMFQLHQNSCITVWPRFRKEPRAAPMHNPALRHFRKMKTRHVSQPMSLTQKQMLIEDKYTHQIIHHWVSSSVSSQTSTWVFQSKRSRSTSVLHGLAHSTDGWQRQTFGSFDCASDSFGFQLRPLRVTVRIPASVIQLLLSSQLRFTSKTRHIAIYQTCGFCF